MKKKESVISKTLIYGFDPEVANAGGYDNYNIYHGTEYPANGFPPGLNGKRFKHTRFIRWEPLQEDIIIRHFGSQIHVNFEPLFPNHIPDKNIMLFQMRSKRVDVQNYICEQINFFTALYDDDNELLTNMFTAKYMTDSQLYTIETFEDYHQTLFEMLFSDRVIDKIRKMVDDNDVGDTIVGLFPVDFLRDIYIVSFMIKVMHIFLDHFMMSTGNNPKDLYMLSAKAYINIMNHINVNMYTLLLNYVTKSVSQTIASNSNMYDMQAINGVTAPTTINTIMKKTLLDNGLIKLTFASEWDKINKRPTYSCVGLIKGIITQATHLTSHTQLKKSLVVVDETSQLLTDVVTSSSSISNIRSFNPGKFSCMYKDLNIIIGQIALEIDISSVDYYLKHLPSMNELSDLLIRTVLYNRFHSSIDIDILSNKQKYILLLYVRHMVMSIYSLNEEDTIGNPLINILMGKTLTVATKTLSKKDLNSIQKYIKLNNLKQYLLSEDNVNAYVKNILHCILSSYSIVNHNAPELLDTQLVYDSSQMTLSALDMIVEIFERMYDE